jgi:hypothetical protein
MPHVRESEPRPDDPEPRDHTPGPKQQPEGKLGGQPINADETAARDHAPDPGGTTGSNRHPEAVEDEPGNDL